jgi:hypothetical protein
MRSIAIPILIAAASAFALQGPTLYSIQVTQDTTVTLGWRNNDAAARIFRVIRKDDPGAAFMEKAYLWNATAWNDPSVEPQHKYYYAVIADDGAGATDTSNTDSITLPALPRICKAPVLTVLENSLMLPVLRIEDRCNAEPGYEIQRALGSEPLQPWKSIASAHPRANDMITMVDSGVPVNSWVTYAIRVLADNLRSDAVDHFVFDREYGATSYRGIRLGNLLGSVPMNQPYWSHRIGDTLFAGEMGAPESTYSVIDVHDPAKPKFVGYRASGAFPRSAGAYDAYYSDGRHLYGFVHEYITQWDYSLVLRRYSYSHGGFTGEDIYTAPWDEGAFHGAPTDMRILGTFNDSLLHCVLSSFSGYGSSRDYDRLLLALPDTGKPRPYYFPQVESAVTGVSSNTVISYAVGSSGFGFFRYYGFMGPGKIKQYSAFDVLVPPNAPGGTPLSKPYQFPVVSQGDTVYGFRPPVQDWKWMAGFLTSNSILVHAQAVHLDTVLKRIYVVNADKLDIYAYDVPQPVRLRPKATERFAYHAMGMGRIALSFPPDWSHPEARLYDLAGRQVPSLLVSHGGSSILEAQAARPGLYLLKAAATGKFYSAPILLQ